MGIQMDLVPIETFKEYLKAANEHNVAEFKMGDTWIKFHSPRETLQTSDEIIERSKANISETVRALSKNDMPPDDQMLFAATDTFVGDLTEKDKKDLGFT
jgi:hypothetical protein